MIGIKVTLPVACFRKGMAREYLETYELPPPSTCYGFLLSLVGETDREAHLGARVTAEMLGLPPRSVVLRTVWRLKKTPLGSPGNTRPDYQQLLTNIELVIWLDSTDETPAEGKAKLEERILLALDPAHRGEIDRFGGLSLGESTHLVNDVSLYCSPSELKSAHSTLDNSTSDSEGSSRLFLLDENGLTTLPVWVDHVGSEKTRYAVGNIVPGRLTPPDVDFIPVIHS